MPSLSDHTRRDAEHALRSAIQVEIGRYSRRMLELGKSHIKEDIEDATREGRAIDGTELGRAAADISIRAYITPGEPKPALEQAPSAGDAGPGDGESD